MSEHVTQTAEKDAPGHYFPPPSSPGIYCCSFCGLLTNRPLIQPCPARVTPPEVTP